MVRAAFVFDFDVRRRLPCTRSRAARAVLCAVTARRAERAAQLWRIVRAVAGLCIFLVEGAPFDVAQNAFMLHAARLFK